MSSESASQTTEKIKITQSGKNVRWVEKKLQLPRWTKRMCKSVVRRVGFDDEVVKDLLFDVNKEFDNGGEYPFVCPDCGFSGEVQSVQSIAFRNKFEDIATRQMIKKNKLDALTNVGSGSPDETGYRPFWILALGERVFTYWMQPGRLALIVGETGASKTTRLLWLMEKFLEHRTDSFAVSNVKLVDKAYGHTYCTLLSDMYLHAIEHKKKGMDGVFGYDEGMTHVSSTRTGGVDVHELENIIALARKLQLCVVLLLQYKERAPVLMRTKYHAYFDLWDFETMYVDISVGKRPDVAGLEFNEVVTYPPNCSWTFESDAPAVFKNDFVVKDALDFLAVYEKEEQATLWDGLRDYLLYRQGKTQLESIPKQFRDFYVWKMYQERGEKITVRTIGDVFDIGKSTVSDIVRDFEEKRRKADRARMMSYE